MKIKTITSFCDGVRIFGNYFDKEVNNWIRRNWNHVSIKDIKYSISGRIKSACIIYEDKTDDEHE